MSPDPVFIQIFEVAFFSKRQIFYSSRPEEFDEKSQFLSNKAGSREVPSY